MERMIFREIRFLLKEKKQIYVRFYSYFGLVLLSQNRRSVYESSTYLSNISKRMKLDSGENTFN